MNCAALPETLIEAELFGHEAGAFTGATKARAGRFEEANGGTLFLDELASLSSPAQDRLLRAIEYGEVTRIGASRPVTVDVRIVAATNEHLPRLVDEGRFRADLLDRLSFEVHLAPGARASNIPFLADSRPILRRHRMDWPAQRGRDEHFPPIPARTSASSSSSSSAPSTAGPRSPDRGHPVRPFRSPWRPYRPILGDGGAARERERPLAFIRHSVGDAGRPEHTVPPDEAPLPLAVAY